MEPVFAPLLLVILVFPLGFDCVLPGCCPPGIHQLFGDERADAGVFMPNRQRLIGEAARGKLIRAATNELADIPLQVELVGFQFGGQFVEQLRVRRFVRFAHVVDGMHQPAPQVLGPEAIGDGASKETVLAARDPVCQLVLAREQRLLGHFVVLEFPLFEIRRNRRLGK